MLLLFTGATVIGLAVVAGILLLAGGAIALIRRRQRPDSSASVDELLGTGVGFLPKPTPSPPPAARTDMTTH